MATNYPTSKQTFTDPQTTDPLNSPSHAGLHTDMNDTVEAIQDKIGTSASTPTSGKVLTGTGVGTSEWQDPSGGVNGPVSSTDTNIPQWSGTGGDTLVDGLAFKDEDNMASNSATALASQQSIKAYTDNLFLLGLYHPRGHVVNGRIVPSVTSNNLTVALKGYNGSDPSASNPVYVRIGDNIRTITSAVSVTKNAGTNWCNAGSSELATKEIDYFVYLGYNATDGVTIGFSRFPGATEYDDFSATSTNEKYCAISNITNAAAGDDYEVVGRFAATLSAGAGYTWTVPTFTNKNLIQKPIYETRWLDYVATISSGSGTLTTTVLTFSSYKFTDNHMFVKASIEITTNGTGATNITLSMPWNAANTFASTGTGREWNVTGDALQTIIESTTNELTIRAYDNTYPGGDGTKHVISIDYEV